MNRETLIEELTQDILAYVMHGGFPKQELAKTLKPEGLDERFDEYELLLNLHFILKPDVVEFVEQLPQRLRNIRTETTTVARTQRGAVDGHINWGATIKTRHAQNPQDTSLFVVNNRSENYDIAENIVLKRLLSIIYTTLRDAEEYLRSEYDWVQDRWRDNQDLIDDLQRIVDRNVHVRRIRSPDTYEPTERMLTTAENARKAIYRDAARLLRTHARLFDGNPDELRELLTQTAITPDDQGTLFELFVLFRFITALEELQGEPPIFQTIKSGRQEIARIDSDPEVVLYHDSSAGDRDLSFRTGADPNDRPLTRSEQVNRVARNVASSYFDTTFENHTGRPDVIVLEIRSDDPLEYEYLITEVKNSTRQKTIRTGIKETLEYLAFLRVNEDYVFGRDDSLSADRDYFGTGWNGLLVIQDLDQPTPSLTAQADDNQEIKILQASELDTELTTILRRLLDKSG